MELNCRNHRPRNLETLKSQKSKTLPGNGVTSTLMALGIANMLPLNILLASANESVVNLTPLMMPPITTTKMVEMLLKAIYLRHLKLPQMKPLHHRHWLKQT
jgi:hypothetical protein